MPAAGGGWSSRSRSRSSCAWSWSWPPAPASPPRSRSTSPRPRTPSATARNVVNVTLVDIRAWDTMGEISVLVVAATGVASLIFIRSRYSARPSRSRERRRGRGHRGRGGGPDGLAARRRDAVAAAPLDRLRGGHPGAVPGDDRGLGLSADRRSQRAGRRLRRWSGRRSGPDHPLPGRGQRRARRGGAGRRRPDPRRRPAGRRARAASPRCWPVARSGRASTSACDRRPVRRDPPGHFGVLRRRRLPGGDRRDARPGPQPRDRASTSTRTRTGPRSRDGRCAATPTAQAGGS